MWPWILNELRHSKLKPSALLAYRSVSRVMSRRLDMMSRQFVEDGVRARKPFNFVQHVFAPIVHENPKAPGIRSINRDTQQVAEYSYGGLLQRALAMAEFFKQQGIKPGDNIAVMTRQNILWWDTILGAWAAGICVVPCPDLLNAGDLSYRIKAFNLRAIVSEREFVSCVEEAVAKAATPIKPICIRSGEIKAGECWLSPDAILEPEALPAIDSNIITTTATTTRSPSVILCTSGTTGNPKGALHGMVYPLMHRDTGKLLMRSGPGQRIYNASGTGWGFTLWTTLGAWLTGAEILIGPTTQRFNPNALMDFIDAEAVTIFCAAPTVLRRLAASPGFAQRQFKHLQIIFCVGEPLDKTSFELIKQVTGAELIICYGQAECTPMTGMHSETVLDHGFTTMGSVMPQYEGRFAIVDDKGLPTIGDNTGEIVVNLEEGYEHPGLMQGYYQAPEATQKAFFDGQYHSGDCGFWKGGDHTVAEFFGREKDSIKLKINGYTISATALEAAGMSYEAIEKIAIVGVPEEPGSMYDQIQAFVLLKQGVEASDELSVAIQTHIQAETSKHTYPKRVTFLSQTEWSQYETTSGKIQRYKLRQRAIQDMQDKLGEEGEQEQKTVNRFALGKSG